jgi:hypothetical protein
VRVVLDVVGRMIGGAGQGATCGHQNGPNISILHYRICIYLSQTNLHFFPHLWTVSGGYALSGVKYHGHLAKYQSHSKEAAFYPSSSTSIQERFSGMIMVMRANFLKRMGEKMDVLVRGCNDSCLTKSLALIVSPVDRSYRRHSLLSRQLSSICYCYSLCILYVPFSPVLLS